jgi:hypothetical protein
MYFDFKIPVSIIFNAFCKLHNDKYTKYSPHKNFRVDAPVTRRTPHSAGREGLPHPVPRF